MTATWDDLEVAISAGDAPRALALVDETPELLWERENGMSAVVTALHKVQTGLAQSLALRVLDALKGEHVPERALYGAIHDLGEAWHTSVGGGWEIAEPVVASFLTSEDEHLRYIAINVLALHWGLSTYRREFAEHLMNDPDLFVRGLAASALGFTLAGTRDAAATDLLLQKLRDESEDGLVRDSSYEGLLEIWLGWDRAWKLTLPRILEDDRAKELDARYDKLLNELYQARAAGDRDREAVLDMALEELSAEKDNDWKRTVDWDLVDQISRGEVLES